jgi:hypothetical protein
MRWLVALTIIILPLLDLAWNLTHIQSGLPDIFGLLAFAQAFAESAIWPATPYFPAGYPLLLVPGGLLGNALAGGYALSAAGMVITLWALYRLMRSFECQRWLALLAVVLAWLSPVYRLPAGNPSVDALYTGLGMWFIAAAVCCWQATARGSAGQREILPYWVRLGICLPPLLLPLLRYHAVILVLPVLLALFIWRRRWWRLLMVATSAVLLAVSFNYMTYYLAYGEAVKPVVGIQIRCGLEFDYRINYATPEHMYVDYIALCQQARTSSVLTDYGPELMAKHTLRSTYYFLRRPPVALAIVLTVVAVLWRRKLPPGVGIIITWVPLYCLALSPAYYTPRSALLPVLVALAAALLLLRFLVPARALALAALITVLALLGGFWRASRYAQLIYQERLHFAQLSSDFNVIQQRQGWANEEIVATVARVLPLSNNPWGLPFPHTETFWTDDPAVRKKQTPGLIHADVDRLALGENRYRAVIYMRNHPRADVIHVIPESPYWEALTELDEMTILVPLE